MEGTVAPDDALYCRLWRASHTTIVTQLPSERKVDAKISSDSMG